MSYNSRGLLSSLRENVLSSPRGLKHQHESYDALFFSNAKSSAIHTYICTYIHASSALLDNGTMDWIITSHSKEQEEAKKWLQWDKERLSEKQAKREKGDMTASGCPLDPMCVCVISYDYDCMVNRKKYNGRSPDRGVVWSPISQSVLYLCYWQNRKEDVEEIRWESE